MRVSTLELKLSGESRALIHWAPRLASRVAPRAKHRRRQAIPTLLQTLPVQGSSSKAQAMLNAVRKAAKERKGKHTRLCRVVHDFVAEGPEELSLRAGDEVQCHQKQQDGWWFGVIVDGDRPRGGLFPGAYVEELPLPAPARPVVLEPFAESLVEGRTAEMAPSPGRAALFAAAQPPGDETRRTMMFIDETREDDDQALRTVLLLERRAEQAELLLKEERQKAAAFRDATSKSLRTLEAALALVPLGGVVLQVPAPDFWDRDEDLEDDVENDLKKALRETLRTGPLDRKTLTWADLCAAVQQVVASHATPMNTVRAKTFEGTAWASPSVLNGPQRETAVPLETPLKQTKIVDLRKPVVPPRSSEVEADQTPQLRALFSAYKEGPHVTPAGFLRLCRDKRLCPDLLDRRDCARLCRLELHGVAGLNEARLGRVFARAAVAAFPTVDPDRAVDELFDRVSGMSPRVSPSKMMPLSPLQIHGHPAYYYQAGGAPAPAHVNNT